MKSLLLFLVFGTIGFALAAEHGALEYREFSSRTGKSLRARLISIDGKMAKLRNSAGTHVTVPIGGMSADDQAYFQTWNPNERRDAWIAEFGLSTFLSDAGFNPMRLNIDENARKLTAKVVVNGQAHDFTVDTGQFLSIIDRNLATTAGAEFSDVTFADFPLADGTKELVKAAVFKTFEVGQAKLTDWEMGTCNFERVGVPLPGKLSADFFEVTDAMIDWRKRTAYLKTATLTNTITEPDIGELREFVSTGGKKMLGELVSLEDGLAKLNVDGGKQLDVDITALSPADREYIDLWSSDPRREGLGDIDLTEVLDKSNYVAAPYSYGNSTVPAFEMKIGEHKVRFLLNPTLPVSYLNQETAMRIQVAASPLQEFLLVGDKRTQIHLAKIKSLSIGGAMQPEFHFRIVDLQGAGQSGAVPIKTCMIFRFPEAKKRLSEQIAVDGILGLDFVTRLGALIDYKSQKMFVKRKTP